MSARVALLSNYKTSNLGNVALSGIVQALFVERYGAENTHPVARLPAPVAFVNRGSDLEYQWEQHVSSWTELAARAGAEPPAGARAVEYTGSSNARAPFPVDLARRSARVVAWSGLGTKFRAAQARATLRDHLATINLVDDVVYNAAGEFNLGSTPSSRLAELAVAQRLGKRTAIINFSFEPNEKTELLAGRLLRKVTLLLPRDERSASLLVECGADPARVIVVPEAVFLRGTDQDPNTDRQDARSAVQPRPAARPGTIGVAVSGQYPTDLDGWARVVEVIVATGARAEFVTNDLSRDRDLVQALQRRTDGLITVAQQFEDLPSYVRHLGALSGVVSNRLHTAVLALSLRVPTAGLDPQGGTKVSGALETAGFGDAVVRGEEDWPDRVMSVLARGVRGGVLESVRARTLSVYRDAFPLGTRP